MYVYSAVGSTIDLYVRFLRRLNFHAHDFTLRCVKYATKAVYLCYGRDDPTLFRTSSRQSLKKIGAQERYIS